MNFDPKKKKILCREIFKKIILSKRNIVKKINCENIRGKKKIKGKRKEEIFFLNKKTG